MVEIYFYRPLCHLVVLGGEFSLTFNLSRPVSSIIFKVYQIISYFLTRRFENSVVKTASINNLPNMSVSILHTPSPNKFRQLSQIAQQLVMGHTKRANARQFVLAVQYNGLGIADAALHLSQRRRKKRGCCCVVVTIASFSFLVTK
jgi:hypothetical protein